MVYIISHRGFLVNGDPENSIPAFQTAVHYGADGIEFDIHLTSDRKFVCFHDDTLLKFGRPDAIEDLSLRELTSIELADGVFIPTLEKVFELFGNKVLLNIEIKTKNDGIKDLIQLINSYGIKKIKSSMIISSFHQQQLKELQSIDPEIPSGYLCNFSRGHLSKAIALNCNFIIPYYSRVPRGHSRLPSWFESLVFNYSTHKTIKDAYNSKLQVITWGTNEYKYINEAFKRNVFGIITDELEKALTISKSY